MRALRLQRMQRLRKSGTQVVAPWISRSCRRRLGAGIAPARVLLYLGVGIVVLWSQPLCYGA